MCSPQAAVIVVDVEEAQFSTMNGVRMFIGSSPKQQPENLPTSLPKVVPLSFGAKSKWPPNSLFNSPPSPPQSESSPKTQTASLNINKRDRLKQVLSTPPAASPPKDDSSSPYSTPLRSTLKTSRKSYTTGSPKRSQTLPNSPPSDLSMRDLSRITESGFNQSDSGNLSKRDELLISLMASEAAIDSKEFDILNAEEVEDLKKVCNTTYSRCNPNGFYLQEHQVLSSRLEAMNKKIALEIKIRDAAVNLSKMNAAHKKVSKQTTEQLEAANQRVESTQKELWKISDRANEIYKRLMEHRAGVLSFSVRSMDKATFNPEDSGYDSNRSTLMSSMSSITGISGTTKSRFDGAHLFAGHADAVVPRPKLSAEAAVAELMKVEAKLKEARDQLALASRKQAGVTRELSIMKLEKEEVETTLGMDLQAAEETIAALEKEIPRLEALNEEVQQLRREKDSWEMERAQLIEQGNQQGIASEELSAGLSTLQSIVKQHGIILSSKESTLLGLLDSISIHLETIHGKLDVYSRLELDWETTKRQMEDDLRFGSDKREALARELAETQMERDAALRESEMASKVCSFCPSYFLYSSSFQSLSHLRTPSSTKNALPPEDADLHASRVVATLQPLWAILPSPEARAAKLSANSNKPYRTGSPTLNGSNGTTVSLSELDVRALKSLYDTRQPSNSPVPSSPKSGNEPFMIEAFAQRVQALINDDKALIERLIRFAQAHDLLKKNAERAQKLAQDGNAAMETYQKQVKMLDERNLQLSSEQADM